MCKTLRVFVVGKNYRLQNIQLSKINVVQALPEQSVYVGGRLGALLILQRSLRVLNPQQPNNGADVGCSEPEGPATRRNSFFK